MVLILLVQPPPGDACAPAMSRRRTAMHCTREPNNPLFKEYTLNYRALNIMI